MKRGYDLKQYEVDISLLRELAKRDSVEVCKRALCRYDDKNQIYYLSYWGDDYRVSLRNSSIERITSNRPEPHEYFGVFLVNYLLQITSVPLSNRWISEKDLLGGSTFFRGPHVIPTPLISSRFENDLDGFCQVCENLSGSVMEMGDASYCFRLTERIGLAIVYWYGDDEFPAEARLLFDQSLSGALALDTLFALAVDFCWRISAV